MKIGVGEVSSSTDIDDFNFGIYPNPTNGIVTLNIYNSIEANNWNVTITETTGKVVFNNSAIKNNGLLDLSHLNTGVYFVNVKSGKSSQIRKLIVE